MLNTTYISFLASATSSA